MSTVDTIERKDERRRRHIAFLLAGLLLVVSVLAGWSKLGNGGAEATEVLGEVFTDRSTAKSGNSTPGQGQANNPGNGQPAPPGGNPRTFGINGSLDEIYPTFHGTLEVTFTNPHRFEIVVTELDVELATPPGICADSLVQGVFGIGDDLENGVLVPRQTGNTDGVSSVAIDFDVSNDLPNSCQGVHFGLTYSGTAIRANQP